MASSIVEHRIRLVLRTLCAAQQGTAQHSLVQHHVASHFRIAPNNLVYCMAFHYGIVHYASTAGRNSVMYSIAPCGLAQCISLVHHGVLGWRCAGLFIIAVVEQCLGLWHIRL